MELITVDEIKSALPSEYSKSVNQELIDGLNKTINEPELYERYRENLISYSHVLREGKFKTSSYLDAVKYVSFKLMNLSNKEAYEKTFPDKIKRFKLQGVTEKDIASYRTAYHKSKLVTLILEQSIIPTWILNQDLYQEALLTQAKLMRTARSEKVRSDAANSVLTHLKQPEQQKIQLDIGVDNGSTLKDLRDATADLVAQQKAMIQSGAMNAQEVAHTKLITDAEYATVPPDTSGEDS